MLFAVLIIIQACLFYVIHFIYCLTYFTVINIFIFFMRKTYFFIEFENIMFVPVSLLKFLYKTVHNYSNTKIEKTCLSNISLIIHFKI